MSLCILVHSSKLITNWQCCWRSMTEPIRQHHGRLIAVSAATAADFLFTGTHAPFMHQSMFATFPRYVTSMVFCPHKTVNVEYLSNHESSGLYLSTYPQ